MIALKANYPGLQFACLHLFVDTVNPVGVVGSCYGRSVFFFVCSFPMIKGFVKHFRINTSDIKYIERRFDDSMSSLSSSNYMIELIVYIVVVV